MPDLFLELLDRAVEAEIGIAVEVTLEDVQRIKNLIYETRKQSGDPRYDSLMVFEPNPVDGVVEIFICKKEAELP